MARLFSRLAKDDRAAVAANVAILVPLFIVATAAAIDMGQAYLARNKLQVSADSAALAAASILEDEDVARSRAIAAAEANLPVAAYGNVLTDEEIVFGRWDVDTRTFTADATPVNAVQVLTRRTTANGNALPAIFAGFVGRSSFDVSTPAIATATSTIHPCYLNGLLASGEVFLKANQYFGSGSCVYSDSQVTVAPKVEFAEGSALTVPDSLLAVPFNPGATLPTITEQDLDVITSAEVNALIDALAATRTGDSLIGGIDKDPSWWNGTVQVRNSGWTPANQAACDAVAGTLQVITSGDVDLSNCSVPEGFGVAAAGAVIMDRPDVEARNLILVGRTVEIKQNAIFGDVDYCTAGGGAVFIAARETVTFNQNQTMYGVQILAGATGADAVNFTSNIIGSPVSIQTPGEVQLDSNGTQFHGCDRADHLFYGGGTTELVLRLVQ